MSDDNFLNAHFPRFGNKLENFNSPEVARRQNHVVFCNTLQAPLCHLAQIAIGIDRRQRRGRNTFRREFTLDLRPERQLRVWTIDSSRSLVGRIHGGEPNDFRARTAGDFQRHRIQPAHAMIQRDGAV